MYRGVSFQLAIFGLGKLEAYPTFAERKATFSDQLPPLHQPVSGQRSRKPSSGTPWRSGLSLQKRVNRAQGPSGYRFELADQSIRGAPRRRLPLSHFSNMLALSTTGHSFNDAIAERALPNFQKDSWRETVRQHRFYTVVG